MPRCCTPLSMLAFVATVASCGSEPAPSAFTTSLPRALTSCAVPPDDLQARLWVSGQSEPCALDVDIDAGTTSGTCSLVPGVRRTVVLEWYVTRALASGDFDLVLAQASKSVDLTQASGDKAKASFGEEDVQARACNDVAGAPTHAGGAETVRIDGVDVAVCDVDNSCDGAGAAPCTNLDELCAGSDPFDDGDEPAN